MNLNRHGHQDGESQKGSSGSKVVAEFYALYNFFLRSLVEQLSFRAWFIMRVLSILVGVTAFSIFSKVVPSQEINAEVAAYYQFTGANPFLDFFLIGMLVTNLITLGGMGLSWLVNSPHYPYYHASPIRLSTILVGYNSFRYLWIAIETVAYILIGHIYGMTFHLNLGLVLVLLTGIFLIFSLELIAAGWNVVTKMGEDPLSWFLRLSSALISGTWIPVWRLPNTLKTIAMIHPQRYINDMARLSMGGGRPLTSLWPQLAPLILITIILLALGYRSFQFGFNKARREGTLGHATLSATKP
jgi:ABC-2 type transport system permease protein